jgi:O-antigen/teichoic acid export membrane protein
MHPYRPRFTLSAIAQFTHFSGWMLVRNISTGLSDHLVNLLIGRVVSVSGLAFFSAARELADTATTELQAPIRRAMFPGFAAVSHDAALMRRSYVDWTAVMVLLTVPIPIGLALVAPDVVRVVLGERWLPVVALLQILACAGIFRASVAGSQLILIAMGKPRSAAMVAVLRAVVLIPLVVVGTTLADAAGAAWAMFAMAAMMFVVNLFVVIGAVRVSRTELFDASWRPVVATLAMSGVVLGVMGWLPGGGNLAAAAVRLFVESIVGLVSYIVAVWALWALAGRPPGAESHALQFARPALTAAGLGYFARR